PRESQSHSAQSHELPGRLVNRRMTRSSCRLARRVQSYDNFVIAITKSWNERCGDSTITTSRSVRLMKDGLLVAGQKSTTTEITDTNGRHGPENLDSLI